MVIALARDLVAALGDLANQFREVVADPAKNEKRRLDVVAIEQVERLLSVSLESRFEAVPLAALNELIEGADLVIVFESNRENVCTRRLHRCAVGRYRHSGTS